MQESKSRTSFAQTAKINSSADDALASYISTLEQKYGMAITEPLPDDLTILVKRLNLLKKSGGRRIV